MFSSTTDMVDVVGVIRKNLHYPQYMIGFFLGWKECNNSSVQERSLVISLAWSGAQFAYMAWCSFH